MQKIPEIPRFTTFQALKFTHSIPRRPLKTLIIATRVVPSDDNPANYRYLNGELLRLTDHLLTA